MSPLIENLVRFLPLLVTVTAVVIVLAAINWFLRRRWQDNPDAQFRFQLIMLALSVAGLLAVIVAIGLVVYGWRYRQLFKY